jgi:hypothetical protein
MREQEEAAKLETGRMAWQELDVVGILAAGFAGTVVLVAFVLFLQGLYHRAEGAVLERVVVTAPAEELQRVRAEQLAGLSSYRWVDEKAGVVAIPIERAMELVAREYGKAGEAARKEAP